MAAIAGIARPGEQDTVVRMLEKIAHRGKRGKKLIRSHRATLLACWQPVEKQPVPLTLEKQAVWDGVSAPLPDEDFLVSTKKPFALAAIQGDELLLARDPLGVKPLYYGKTGGTLVFSSEVKALLSVTQDIHEFPPATVYTTTNGFRRYKKFHSPTFSGADENNLISGLRMRLEQAVLRRIITDEMGCWLSGGLDSSAIAALARPHVRSLHSFVSGVEGAEDLEYGRQMAVHLNTIHHERIVTREEMLHVLPQVIYHLESFDALLVRSSITNYLTSEMVADFTGAVFSGEAGDELFAGYDYLKSLPTEALPAELEDILMRLHNTALQRVDRCAQANGVIPFVPFTDPDVVDFALHIPPQLKIYKRGDEIIEKWILRRAVEDLLPASVLWRPKAKFWQGAGVQNLIEEYANQHVSDADFKRERQLPNGWVLNTKEELFYYRIFKDHFGELENLDWMGRTKGAPLQ
ncbi:MAG: asparagine synthase B [Bellilinea sp.]|nr:MAG: asparagine synthase B [Bellilinea sp.]